MKKFKGLNAFTKKGLKEYPAVRVVYKNHANPRVHFITDEGELIEKHEIAPSATEADIEAIFAARGVTRETPKVAGPVNDYVSSPMCRAYRMTDAHGDWTGETRSCTHALSDDAGAGYCQCRDGDNVVVHHDKNRVPFTCEHLCSRKGGSLPWALYEPKATASCIQYTKMHPDGIQVAGHVEDCDAEIAVDAGDARCDCACGAKIYINKNDPNRVPFTCEAVCAAGAVPWERAPAVETDSCKAFSRTTLEGVLLPGLNRGCREEIKADEGVGVCTCTGKDVAINNDKGRTVFTCHDVCTRGAVPWTPAKIKVMMSDKCRRFVSARAGQADKGCRDLLAAGDAGECGCWGVDGRVLPIAPGARRLGLTCSHLCTASLLENPGFTPDEELTQVAGPHARAAQGKAAVGAALVVAEGVKALVDGMATEEEEATARGKLEEAWAVLKDAKTTFDLAGTDAAAMRSATAVHNKISTDEALSVLDETANLVAAANDVYTNAKNALVEASGTLRKKEEEAEALRRSSDNHTTSHDEL
eukprot:TRINITY_DN7386_c0_g3_i1.p1 TRINITY_DN7386_c0_g3~~TRINITY_DN7386_c0_g3_i1.p1  ORF type:complete len:530 (+),score=124.48 TRINITY_DN7386_c0_g3_i1:190-1779(+)